MTDASPTAATPSVRPATDSAAESGLCPDDGYRSYRAQQKNRTALISPPLADSELLLKENLQSQHNDDFWGSLRDRARTQMLADARQYTSNYRDLPATCDAVTFEKSSGVSAGSRGSIAGAQPILMAGHQPTLFHPGVWFKNFALQQISSDLGACGVNLVIDNDVAASRSIRIPTRDSVGRVRYAVIPYDLGGAGIPYEQAKIRDLRQFDRFDREVLETVAPLVADPCVTQLWPHAREAIRRCEIAGCALAQARHSLEADIGWQTLEIPLGVAVRGLPFARFVMEIIDEIERFHGVYNGSAEHYRAWHGIRSSAHPVPNLHRDGEWWELPLWVYGNDSPVRRAVWVRRQGEKWQISDRSETAGRRDVWVPVANRDSAAEALASAASPEFKLRPRALVTTLFARLTLSDLFFHGIGGGKYDQLADRIICQFFGLTPPAFQVVSATVRLPGQDLDLSRSEQISNLRQLVRETLYHGEKWVDPGAGQNSARIAQKRALLDHPPEQGGRADWHREIAQINAHFADQLHLRRLTLQSEIQKLKQEAAQEQILASRELSFCLYSLDDLIPAFHEMLR